MKLFNYNITSDKEGIHPIYVCDACWHELDRCCNSEVEFTITAEFHGHNPRAVGYVQTRWKSIYFRWKWEFQVLLIIGSKD